MAGEMFDLRTLEGIEAAERDLGSFQSHVANCYTATLLPWSLVIGRRWNILAKARAALSKAAPAEPSDAGERK